MTDPSGNGRAMWVGTEVEGRLKGTRTLFIADPRLTFDDISDAAEREHCCHLYALKSFWPGREADILTEWASECVTFEFPLCGLADRDGAGTLLQHRAEFWRFQFTLGVNGADYALLEAGTASDEVRIDVSERAFENTCIPLVCLSQTTPEDYAADYEVKL